MPRDTESADKRAKECPWDKTRTQKAKKSQMSREKDPTTDHKSSRATSFHPENPWRGKLEEEEIIVLHFIVYYRGHGVR